MTNTNHSVTLAGPGHQIFAFGAFWPAALVDVSQAGGSVMIPDQLWLIEGDRIMLQIGQFPAFPVVVKAVNLDCIGFAFVDAVHPSVAAALLGDDCDADASAQHVQMAFAA